MVLSYKQRIITVAAKSSVGKLSIFAAIVHQLVKAYPEIGIPDIYAEP